MLRWLSTRWRVGFRLGAAGAPRLDTERGRFEALFGDTKADFGPLTVARVLAWLDPEAMLKALERQIDALPDAPLSLTEAAKAKRIGELGAELEGLERQEEGLDCGCGRAGAGRPAPGRRIAIGCLRRHRRKAGGLKDSPKSCWRPQCATSAVSVETYCGP